MTPTELKTEIRNLTNTIDQARKTLATCQHFIPPALIACDQATGDGWRPRGEQGQHGGHSDPVGATIEDLADILEIRTQMRLTITTATEAPRNLLNLLRHLTEIGARSHPQAPLSPPTCTAGIHMTGYPFWGRTDTQGAPTRCDDLTHADGLCASCWSARRRWHTAQRDGRTYQRKALSR